MYVRWVAVTGAMQWVARMTTTIVSTVRMTTMMTTSMYGMLRARVYGAYVRWLCAGVRMRVRVRAVVGMRMSRYVGAMVRAGVGDDMLYGCRVCVMYVCHVCMYVMGMRVCMLHVIAHVCMSCTATAYARVSGDDVIYA